MTRQTPNLPTGQSDEGFDLSQIFIGRQQQLDLFEIYLKRWKKLILDFISDETPVKTAPAPDNKIQGLVVLLFGRGGFGKSTSLKHYRDMVLQGGWNLATSRIVDWEFAVEGKRSLFNPPQGQRLDAAEYFKVLCGQLALALDKEPKDFKAYQSAVKDVEKAISLDPQEWDAYFWKGMLLAYYWGQSHAEEAVTMIKQSLAVGLPPILLTPLYWLEKDRPGLFVNYARPLLLQYNV